MNIEVPFHTPLSFVGAALFIIGVGLVLGGMGIAEALHIRVKRKWAALSFGIVFAMVGLLCLYVESWPTSERNPFAPALLPSRAEVQETEGFAVQLQSCKRSMNTVICEFRVTSRGQDRTLSLGTHYVGSSARMFDQSNNESGAQSVQIANKSGPNVTSLLVADVPTKVSFTFANVQPESQVISLLEVQSKGFVLQYLRYPLASKGKEEGLNGKLIFTNASGMGNTVEVVYRRVGKGSESDRLSVVG